MQEKDSVCVQVIAPNESDNSTFMINHKIHSNSQIEPIFPNNI